MYTIQQYESPESLKAAFALYTRKKNSVLLGGTTFLRLGNKNISCAIDLAGLGLNKVYTDSGNEIHIGAMCTLRELEVSPCLQTYGGGFLSQAAGQIVGVQFRNLATLGASVFSKYGFSDLLPPLLACGAKVILQQRGTIDLKLFLDMPFERDILTEVVLPPGNGVGRYECMRNSQGDFAILNASLYLDQDRCRLAVGARPGRAKLAEAAGDYIYSHRREPLAAVAEKAGIIACNELSFGSNMRGSGPYRKHLCGILTKRLVYQVLGTREG